LATVTKEVTTCERDYDMAEEHKLSVGLETIIICSEGSLDETDNRRVT
jgi:hypothetical protein